MAPSSPTITQRAIQYARKGWKVFPLHSIVDDCCSCGNADCTSPGKHPRTARGVLNATSDESQIVKWWEDYPDANIGIATGRTSGIVVADLDVKTAGPENWSSLLDAHGSIDTLTTITGSGGAHWIFQAPATPLRSTTSQIAKGIDTRAEGGYIVAPPSNHISGQLYEWDNMVAPTLPPDWLLELWPQHQAPDEVASSNGIKPEPSHPFWVKDLLENGAEMGERNSQAHRLASYFRIKGHPRDVILEILKSFAEKCAPPLSLPELQQTIDSAQRYAVQVAEARVSDPPEFQEGVDLLVYTWREPGVRIQLEQLHKNKTGTHCEITIDSVGGEQQRALIGPVTYNLTSLNSRETLARNLNKRWEIDWAEVLEKLARMATAHLRVGQPPVQLRDYMHRPHDAWLLHPLILEDQPSILFGPGGLGKSLIALAAMLSLESGTPLLPGLQPTPGHRGIYLDWERTGTYEHGTRYRRLLAGANLEPANVDGTYLSCTGSISDNLRHIKRVIDNEGITFAIVDSAGFACGAEPEKAESALLFFDCIHQLGIPCLIIAHQTKGDTRGMPFGSVFWHNSARSTWEIRAQQTAGESTVSLGLFNRKSNVGSLAKPLGFRLEFHERGAMLTAFDPRTNTEIAKGAVTVADQIAAFLAEGPKDVRELAELTGSTEGSIRTTLNAHKDRFAREAGGNLWGIAYPE